MRNFHFSRTHTHYFPLEHIFDRNIRVRNTRTHAQSTDIRGTRYPAKTQSRVHDFAIIPAAMTSTQQRTHTHMRLSVVVCSRAIHRTKCSAGKRRRRRRRGNRATTTAESVTYKLNVHSSVCVCAGEMFASTHHHTYSLQRA